MHNKQVATGLITTITLVLILDGLLVYRSQQKPYSVDGVRSSSSSVVAGIESDRVQSSTKKIVAPSSGQGSETAPSISATLTPIDNVPHASSTYVTLLGTADPVPSGSTDLGASPPDISQQSFTLLLASTSESERHTIIQWLTSNGLAIVMETRTVNDIQFVGTFGDIDNTFHVQLHDYISNGSQCYENPIDQSIPKIFESYILRVASLGNCFADQW